MTLLTATLDVPTPSTDSTAMGRFWTADSQHYSHIVQDELASFRREVWADRFRAHLGEGPLRVLDFGCGPGFFSILLSQLGHQVTGIDIAQGMIREAMENARSELLTNWPTFYHCETGLAAFEGERFDVIVSRNVTWTLADPEGFYREALRVLAPQGKLIIYDANWHLPLFDEAMGERARQREALCLAQYGSTFEPAQIDADPIDVHALPLSKVRRPDWDQHVLRALGFGVTVDETIVDALWDDKEKLVYGETPLFEIVAQKR